MGLCFLRRVPGRPCDQPIRMALGPSLLWSARPPRSCDDDDASSRLCACGELSSRQLEARVARAENVRAALALVERGAAPLGIVYATDALASRAIRVVGVFPAASHPPIRYPIARTARSRDVDAERFRRFLLAPPGRAILSKYGFTAP